MNRSTIGRIGTVGLLLGTATVACTPQTHVASLSETASPGSAAHAQRLAAEAKAAIAQHKGDEAVKAAEKAVALAPNNADDRMLLGQAYLTAGRFASAETAFHDSLTLSPDQPRARFNLALAEIAQNKGTDAQGALSALHGRVPDSDLGLALALAGDQDNAIRLLGDLVRSGKSDARSRQNLALALALGGHWNEARAVAMQDTPPARLKDQLASWADLARPGQAARQIATMLGTTPALADAGQPAQLALAAPTAAAPVEVALAAPAPVAPVQPVVPTAAPAAATPAPAPVQVAAMSAPAPARIVEAPVPVKAAPPAAQLASAEVPAMITAPRPAHAVTPPPLIRAPAQAMRVAYTPATPAKSVAPGPELVAVRQGGFVVQLGAFSRAAMIDSVWNKAAKLTPNMVHFTPVRGSTSLSGATLVRLSVGGFKTRADAAALCSQLKARGQACFVRGVGNDAPLQWVRKDDGKSMQLASLKGAFVAPHTILAAPPKRLG